MVSLCYVLVGVNLSVREKCCDIPSGLIMMKERSLRLTMLKIRIGGSKVNRTELLELRTTWIGGRGEEAEQF